MNKEVLFSIFSFNCILIFLSLAVLSFFYIFLNIPNIGQQQQAPEKAKKKKKKKKRTKQHKEKKDALVCLPHILTPLCVHLSGDRAGSRAKEQHCYNLR